MKILCNNLLETKKLALNIYEQLNTPIIISLHGLLGSGKTTFVKYCLSKVLNEDLVTSPTFTIVNLYNTSKFNILHLDLYRVKSFTELYELGIEDYINKAVFFIEWPELFYKAFGLEEKYRIDINVIANIREYQFTGLKV